MRRCKILAVIICFMFFGPKIIGAYANNGTSQETLEIQWVDTPKTYTAALLYTIESKMWDEYNLRVNPTQSASNIFQIHKITNRLITIGNSLYRFWVLILGLFIFSLFSHAYLLISKNKNILLLWFSASFNILATLSMLASFPYTRNTLVSIGIYLFTFIGVISSLISLVNALGKSKGKTTDNKLIYGPKIKPLHSQESGIEIGKVNINVLPESVRWISDENEGKVVLPYDKLSQGVTIIGDMGSGKTRIMMKIHDELFKTHRNIPILIHDPKGEWYRTYFNPKTDVVFSPHIENSACWTIFDDLKNHPELLYEVINTAVFARQNRDDVFWSENAVNLLKNAFSHDTFTQAIEYLQQQKIKNGDDKFFMSVYGTARLALNDILKIEIDSKNKKHLPGPKTIDDYLNHHGRIFLMNNPAYAAEQKGILNLFLSMFFLRAISREDAPMGTIRVAAIIDEILSFNIPPDVARRIFTISRSKGLAIISAAQRFARENREMSEWQNAEYLLGMKIIDQKTQENFSKRAGQIHYEKKFKSKTKGEGSRNSQTESSHVQKDSLIPPDYFGYIQPKNFVLFHQGGITPGIASNVSNQQNDIPMPAYDPKNDVLELVKSLD